MKKLVKWGRFAFLLPHLILPFYVAAVYNENFDSGGLTLAFLIPFAIKSPLTLLYPVCLAVSLLCFLLCARDCKRKNDAAERKRNRIFLALAIAFPLLACIGAAYLLSGFIAKV